mgnify:FL=1
MASIDRLPKLRMRPQYAHMPDDLLLQMLDEALGDFFAYTNRRSDPGEAVDSLIIDIAASKLNFLGLEGFKRGKDGEMEREAENLQELFLRRMDSWRVAMWPRSSR